ncbi:L-lactate permease [Sciscionella marina]|uniref:L-lactate permease n=1 Tax=Sciscionella marina TaxID=508770 RepID=UPI00037122C1|nr:L-lactate permease [Sciscionella marina]
MTLGFAVTPLIVVLGLSIMLRMTAHRVAWIGVITAVLIVLVVPDFSFTTTPTLSAVAAACLLTGEAAMVIIPGLYLNAELADRRIHSRLAQWIQTLPIPAEAKIGVVVVGLGPALESLTGFGVSLLLTVPVLLAISERDTALRRSALSLNIMPWGTLGLASTVAASLTGHSLATIGWLSSLVSAAIFPVLGAVATAIASSAGARGRYRSALPGAMIGACFSATLVACNGVGIVELAGVTAGLVSTVAGIAVFARTRLRYLAPPREAITPYGIALGLVIAVRILIGAGVRLDEVAVRVSGVAFQPLSSPGLALLATGLFLARGRLRSGPGIEALKRSRTTLTALLGFAVLAQLMAVSGMVATIGHVLTSSGILGAIFLSPALGIFSGFLTGSNTGANALMAPVQSTAATALGIPSLLPAVQNSAAGHAVFASLPETLLVLAVAGDTDAKEERALINFNLRVLGSVYLLLTATTAALVLL